MIWVVRQFITHHLLEFEGERVRFPIRVEIEYKQEGTQRPNDWTVKKVLYNKSFLLKHYSGLKERDLDLLVKERVREAIEEDLAMERMPDGPSLE